MKRFLLRLLEALHKRSKEPWAMFETNGIDGQGRVRIETYWNEAFIENARNNRLPGNTPEEIVTLFFVGAQIKPYNFEDDNVASDAHINLAADSNQLKRG